MDTNTDSMTESATECELDGMDVLLEASVAFGVPLSAAKHSRAQRPVLARAAAMCILYRLGWTLQRTGEELGGYHHTTVLHHREQHESRMRHEPGYAERFKQLADRLASRLGDVHGSLPQRLLLPGEVADLAA